MWWRKACPRCGGDVFEERLLGERELKCLQCGRALLREQLPRHIAPGKPRNRKILAA